MATIVNARDVLLQAAADRLLDIDLPGNINVPIDNIPSLIGVSLTATSQLFQIPDTGPTYPSTITLKAIVRGIVGTLSLSVVDGTMVGTPAFDVDLEYEFAESDMTSDSVTFRAEVAVPDPLGGPDIIYSDQYTILKTRESSGGVVGFLTNENFTVTANSSGSVVTYTGASGHFVVIQGVTDVTNSCTFAVQDNPQGLTVTIDPGGVDAGEFSVTGGFSPSDDNATVTFRATYGTLTIDKVFSLSKAKTGGDGSAGAPGDKTAKAFLYAWSTAQPSNPNGSSTYTWATGAHTAFTGPTWTTTVGSNPGGSNVKLWVAEQTLVESGGTTSTTLTWNSSGVGYTVYAQGANGINGLQQAQPTVYRWAASIPAGPSGTDTYTWSSASYSGPSGIGSTWFFTPPSSPSAGFTLWGATVALNDSASNATTNFNWTSASISARGYAGNNGSTGSTGAQGASARTAYARIAGNPTPLNNNITTGGSSTFPNSTQSNTLWGINVSWSGTDPNPASTNTLYQTDGFYDPATGNTVWNTPYISSLKVGSLSAITANMGNLTVDGNLTVTTGGVMGGNFTSSSWPASGGGFFLGPDSGNYKLRLGRLASGQYFEVDQAGNVSTPNLTITGGVATFSGALSAVTGSFGNITLGGLMYSSGKTNYDSGNGVMIGAQSGYSYLGVTYQSGATIRGMWVSSQDGIVHMTGADVIGGTVTSSVFQTATSGRRIILNESSGNTFKVYDGSSNVVAQIGRAGTGAYSGETDVAFFQEGSNYAVSMCNTAAQASVYASAGSSKTGVYSSSSGGYALYATNANDATTPAIYVNGGIQAVGKFAVNGNTPQAKASVNGACTDLATAIALINQLRAALIANGICV